MRPRNTFLVPAITSDLKFIAALSSDLNKKFFTILKQDKNHTFPQNRVPIRILCCFENTYVSPIEDYNKQFTANNLIPEAIIWHYARLFFYSPVSQTDGVYYFWIRTKITTVAAFLNSNKIYDST